MLEVILFFLCIVIVEYHLSIDLHESRFTTFDMNYVESVPFDMSTSESIPFDMNLTIINFFKRPFMFHCTWLVAKTGLGNLAWVHRDPGPGPARISPEHRAISHAL